MRKQSDRTEYFCGRAILTLTIILVLYCTGGGLQGTAYFENDFALGTIYRKTMFVYRTEYGELSGKITAFAPKWLDDPGMPASFILPDRYEEENRPIVICPASPHWFYQKFCVCRKRHGAVFRRA